MNHIWHEKYHHSFSAVFAVSLTFSQVDLGDKVPNFTTVDQDGAKWVLKKQLKSADYLVIYFYPAAFTGGCTKQACSYRDQKGNLIYKDTEVDAAADSNKVVEFLSSLQ